MECTKTHREPALRQPPIPDAAGRHGSRTVRVLRNGMAALVIGTAALAPATGASALEQETEYHISIAGLPVARAVFSTSLSEKTYRISGHVKTSGLADIIADIRAETKVSGTIASDALRAQTYDLVYSSGKKTSTYKVSFNKGRVVSNSIAPKPSRPREWVPVDPGQLTSVLDPISGLIFPQGRTVCPRSLPIFDGETRMDLELDSKGTRPFSADGYKGNALVCSVRFVPRSGYKKGRKDIEYLRNSSQMEIWFASAGKLNLMAPVYVRIPTRIGMMTISAERITN